jgi:hypothetical protein
MVLRMDYVAHCLVDSSPRWSGPCIRMQVFHPRGNSSSSAALVGKELVLLTDNEAVVSGWQCQSIANDEPASIIIRAVH